jgi:hypothetical protein
MRVEYRLTTNGMTIGISTRTLQRNGDGTFNHQLHTVPKGFARTFTQTEWFEEGRFRVRGNTLEPLFYEKYRRGGKAHQHSTSFDWEKLRVTYRDGRQDPLPTGALDGASVFYALMLNPPADGSTGRFTLTNGKRFSPYEYRFVRKETIATPLGDMQTNVIEWRSTDETDDDRPHFTAWMAPQRQYVPVRVIAKEGRRTAVMEISKLDVTPAVAGTTAGRTAEWNTGETNTVFLSGRSRPIWPASSTVRD